MSDQLIVLRLVARRLEAGRIPYMVRWAPELTVVDLLREVRG